MSNPAKSAENANNPSHYILLTIATFIGLAGVFVRFLGDSFFWTSLSNVILIVGIIISLKAVFAIMK
ncbi:hypothetical protein [Mucilaginibacter myungsuensis]|uniref:Uncharacterized protein n=1 Tax=Mucilaginibacter myungsuensis TaxID=649104 RepID=A0A929L6N3_9SPHI|nr:hypothetical protein [Mucilaginibacter myungsuensis]MBE9664171.1 hypothetical protein [Mucilaginibacter myungsuensis]MDN3599874.1 hypothetical protein [Mucilaginibacter myungsuensis]